MFLDTAVIGPKSIRRGGNGRKGGYLSGVKERTLDWKTLQSLPKVLLHEHLDGGLRPQTVLELAQAAGHKLPAEDPDALAEVFGTSR